jgi:hypothetical protein
MITGSDFYVHRFPTTKVTSYLRAKPASIVGVLPLALMAAAALISGRSLDTGMLTALDARTRKVRHRLGIAAAIVPHRKDPERQSLARLPAGRSLR